MNRALHLVYANKLLILLLLGAFFVRVYRINEILGFYFDQGRDALVINDLLREGKFFLIGPTTGIAGIFRGPFYYYLITPFYWIGRGDPAFPAFFLASLTVVALFLLHILSKIAAGGNKISGIFALFLSGFSFYLVYASRWLSNPTPMLLFSMLILFSMYKITLKKEKWWVVLSFALGASQFHFGSSGEFFYFPAIFVFILWQIGIFRKKIILPKKKIIILSILAFGITFSPLLIFDLRHDFILSNNIAKFFGEDQSFKANFWDVFQARINFILDVFYSKIFLNKRVFDKILFFAPLVVGLVNIRFLLKNSLFKITLLFLMSLTVGLMFFQGNEGNIYDYYLTGYYLMFVLLFSVCLSFFAKSHVGIIFLTVFFANFFSQNLLPVKSYITDGLDGPETISFGNQKKAMNWIFSDAGGANFNIDAYVPPVIPYSYEYLGRWYTQGLKKVGLSDSRENLLYTIYEVDTPHPERLDAWMKRQNGIGQVVYSIKFGGITVERRTRINPQP